MPGSAMRLDGKVAIVTGAGWRRAGGLHGRPLGFVLKPKAGDADEVHDERPAPGTQARFGTDR